jgi:hypothetical protein
MTCAISVPTCTAGSRWWRALGLVSVPSIFAIIVGCLMRSSSPLGSAVLLGGALAFPLALVGTSAILYASRRPIVYSLVASTLSLLIRIGGVACAFAVLRHHAQASAIVGTLTACVSLSLIMEMLAAVRFVRPRIADQELARA